MTEEETEDYQTLMDKTGQDQPGKDLKQCKSCKKYFEDKDISNVDRECCRFCRPHCAVCLSEKHLNEFWDKDSLDVLCISCQHRFIRTCEKCNKTYRDWLCEEGERCEDCDGLTDSDDESD